MIHTPDTSHAPATSVELEQIRREGFFIRRQFFTPDEMAAFVSIADAAVADYESRLQSDGFISKKGKISFVNSLDAHVLHHEAIDTFSLQPKVGALARSVAGPRAGLFAWQLVYKYPNPDVFPWHQDDNYSQTSRGYFSIWAALNRVKIENGCLWVHPGMSLDSLLPVRKGPLGFECWSVNDPNQGQPVELEAGDIVVFTSKLPHKSGVNVSNDVRKGHIIAFADVGQTFGGKEMAPACKAFTC
ncbi:MAG: phytanoyl-CoA dioxygenase family protein [Verrucomicrobiae bacterium]|nr:phytanoyl-CoA dioxygenase family protein [Verrucomicrobiae bacterium]